MDELGAPFAVRARPSRRGFLAASFGLGAVAVLSSCGVTRGDDSRDILMLIPNSPGGGYDQTGREAVDVMKDDGITGGSFTVDNVVGGGGSLAMAKLMGKSGREDTLMTIGLGVVGSLYSTGNEFKVTDATPIAQLMSEPEGVLVPADSPLRTIKDLVASWQKDPDGITVGGGSSPGGPDHLFPMQLAQTVGVEPRDVNYVPYDGGGPLTSALLGEKIDVGFSGLAEFEKAIQKGDLRVLAVSGEERLPQKTFAEVPTLTESDIDLVFLNWRGVLAPPDIPRERREEFVSYFEEMHATKEWKSALTKYGWTDDFKVGDDFTSFLKEQDDRVSGTLKELGLL